MFSSIMRFFWSAIIGICRRCLGRFDCFIIPIAVLEKYIWIKKLFCFCDLKENLSLIETSWIWMCDMISMISPFCSKKHYPKCYNPENTLSLNVTCSNSITLFFNGSHSAHPRNVNCPNFPLLNFLLSRTALKIL